MINFNTENKKLEKFEQFRDEYIKLIFNNELDRALKFILNLKKMNFSIKDIYLNVFRESLYKIGDMWENNEIDVGDEHYFSESTKIIMSHIFVNEFNHEENQKNIICGTIEGEYHEIGIKMISDLLYAEGFNINYLGTNVPIKSYMRFLNKNNFDAILISVTLKKNLDNLKKLVKSIKKEDNLKKLMVIVGGYPFYEDSNLYKKIGADFFGNDIEDIQFYLKYEKERNL